MPCTSSPERTTASSRAGLLAGWLALGLGLVLCGHETRAQSPAESPTLHTNQSYLEEVAQPTALDIGDLPAVFEFVFSSLPDTVRVYPTENYYYFSFHVSGIKYAGNFRLDATDRDKGIIHFAYFTAYNDWNRDLISHYKALSTDDGVRVEKREALTYRVTYEGKSVTFKLNDLSNVRPRAGTLHDDESFIGPMFDESGLQLFLVYNRKIKAFHYILNELTPVPEHFSPSEVSDRIVVGNRTGFAFYEDRRIDRRILIGVYDGNARVNNYFDGPFDQLPDNFIKGDTLKTALEEANPELKGSIDRFGNASDGQGRVSIAPYTYYSHESELAGFDLCAGREELSRDAYYACFDSSTE